MSKLVSNDALWEKLSEIEEKINRYSKVIPAEEQADIAPLLTANKDEIAGLFRKGLQGLGTHGNSHFQKIYQHIKLLEQDIEGIYKILNCINAILQEPKEQPETKPETEVAPEAEPKPDKSYLYFWFFKVRKTTLIITVLGLLVFLLTLFCMKQQNDYSLLSGEYYRLHIVLREKQAETNH